MTPVAVLISGGGSNMVALVEAMQSGRIPARPVLVLANRADARGLARAKALGVPTAVIDHRDYGARTGFEAALDRALETVDAEVIACAGFMRILTPDFVQRWQGRMLNIHPSLLPLFRGLDTHARALEAGVAIHGCTVHEVVSDLDAGPILGQAAVAVHDGDTADSLAARVLAMEHRLYPAVLGALLADEAALRRAPIALFPDPDR